MVVNCWSHYGYVIGFVCWTQGSKESMYYLLHNLHTELCHQAFSWLQNLSGGTCIGRHCYFFAFFSLWVLAWCGTLQGGWWVAMLHIHFYLILLTVLLTVFKFKPFHVRCIWGWMLLLGLPRTLVILDCTSQNIVSTEHSHLRNWDILKFTLTC